MVNSPKASNRGVTGQDSSDLSKAAGARAGTGTGTGGTAGRGAGPERTGTAASDKAATKNAPPVVEFAGIPFDDPSYSAPVAEPEDFDLSSFFAQSEPEPAPRKTTRRGKSGEPASLGVPTDPDTSASFILLTVNSMAIQTAGSEAAMTDPEYAAIHRPLSEIIRQSKYAKDISKYSAPFALVVASFSYANRVYQVYRRKHPPKVKNVGVTPNPETPATATVITPDVVENGTRPEDIAQIASMMGI